MVFQWFLAIIVKKHKKSNDLTKAFATWEGPSPSQVANVFVRAARPGQLALTKAFATWGGPSSSQVAKVFVSAARPGQFSLTKAFATWEGPSPSQVANVSATWEEIAPPKSQMLLSERTGQAWQPWRKHSRLGSSSDPPRSSQESPGAHRIAQELSGEARSYQESPGAPRRRQESLGELPGDPKASKPYVYTSFVDSESSKSSQTLRI